MYFKKPLKQEKKTRFGKLVNSPTFAGILEGKKVRNY